MSSALVYLMTRSIRGKIVRTLRLLKQPKYLVGVVVFIAWMAFWVGGPIFFDDDRGAFNIELFDAELIFSALGDALPAIQLAIALVIALLISLWWLVPWSRMALSFTEAEIHMLVPLPIKRRDLIQYATLKSQPGILFGCLMMTLFLGSGGPLDRVRWYASFWLVLTLWDLHSKGRSLWLEKQKELASGRRWRNRLLLTGAILIYWILLGAALSSLLVDLMQLRPAPGQEVLEFLRETLVRLAPNIQSTLLGWLLFPFVLVTAPLFITAPGVTPAMQLTGAIMPLVLLLAHNEWVVRSQAKFEEAALAHARREATKKASGSRYWKTSLRSRRRTPFALPPSGAPEMAILWKNSMLVTRFSYRTLAGFGLAVIGFAFVASFLVSPWFRAAPFLIIVVGLFTMVISPLTGAQNYRNDLRTDLLQVDMLRPWPLEGWKLFAAQVAGPTVFAIMSAALGAGLVLAMSLYMAVNRVSFTDITSGGASVLPERASAALGAPAALILPLVVCGALPVVLALTCLAAALQNLLVLVFPGWIQLGSKKQQGAAAFGQNMIMFFGLGLAGLLCMVPASLLIAVILAIQWFAFGLPLVAWEFPVLGVVAATPVLAAAALIVRGGGRVWDDLDPSREVLEGSG